MKKSVRTKPAEKVWAAFQEEQTLTDEQLEQFCKYEALLTEWNRTINLTAITDIASIVSRHFTDSLVLRQCLDLTKINLIADIGSGAGFPSIPLKIMFPHLGLILLEVSKKRQKFLQALISILELKDVVVCDLDWRTFLRKTESNVEYFLARASLDPLELSRMFKPGCAYKNAKLVYWAAEDWEPDQKIAHLVREKYEYILKRKKRKLIFMGL